MADDEDRQPRRLAQVHERHRAVLDLTDAAGRGLVVLFIERLDGVGNENVGPDRLNGLKRGVQTGLREHIKLV